MVRTNASCRARRWTGETPTADVPEVAAAEAETRIDERLALLTALAALPLRQRQAVVLRYFDDLSVDAVAEIMGSSPGTVKSQSAKGLAKLRAALASDEQRVEQP
jgi:RNA polymerase sigma factor (sigma-70 family)